MGRWTGGESHPTPPKRQSFSEPKATVTLNGVSKLITVGEAVRLKVCDGARRGERKAIASYLRIRALDIKMRAAEPDEPLSITIIFHEGSWRCVGAAIEALRLGTLVAKGESAFKEIKLNRLLFRLAMDHANVDLRHERVGDIRGVCLYEQDAEWALQTSDGGAVARAQAIQGSVPADRVGYKRPPAKNKFKSGTSGNPSGARKLPVSSVPIIGEDTIYVTKGGRRVRVSMHELVSLKLQELALKDPDYLQFWIKLQALETQYAELLADKYRRPVVVRYAAADAPGDVLKALDVVTPSLDGESASKRERLLLQSWVVKAALEAQPDLELSTESLSVICSSMLRPGDLPEYLTAIGRENKL